MMGKSKKGYNPELYMMYLTACCLEFKFRAGNWTLTKANLRKEIRLIVTKTKLHSDKVAKKLKSLGEDQLTGWINNRMKENGLFTTQGNAQLLWCHSQVEQMIRMLPGETLKEIEEAKKVLGIAASKKEENANIPQNGNSSSSSLVGQSNKWMVGSTDMQIMYLRTMSDVEKCLLSDDILNGTRNGFCAIDCEGVPDSLDLIQIAIQPQQAGSLVNIYVIDCVILSDEEVCSLILPLFQSSLVIKLLHDLHKDVVALARAGIEGCSMLLDTQLAAEYLTGDPFVGMNDLFRLFEVPEHPTKNEMKKTMRNDSNLWQRRPLQKHYIEYAALDAGLLLSIMPKLVTESGNDVVKKLVSASLTRAEFALNYNGKRSVCFDTENDYATASSELLDVFRPESVVKNKPLKNICEVKDLLKLLPADLLPKLVQEGTDIPSDMAELDLVDINLDVGRRACCWMGNDRVFLSNDEDRKITIDEIDDIVSKLGGFGSDNRAGLEQKLHRISGMCNRHGELVGLSMRVGRWFEGNAAMLVDLLLGSDKSILILGEPGSGKTTIVREAVRVLASKHNVCVVDTSNEIAGDGNIPHPCIGDARRMMVPSLDAQSSVMVECVQNHTPHIMVIDEIGRPREVEAARTVKQRGVRIIASAHGDLRKLLKNKELRGLVGGVENVTLGDAAAKEEAKRKLNIGGNGQFSKTKVQRMGEPTFDVIVEVRRGEKHEWRITRDAAAAVDAILDGQKYKAELRTRDPRLPIIMHDFVKL